MNNQSMQISIQIVGTHIPTDMSEYIEDIIAHTLWQYGYNGVTIKSSITGNKVLSRDLRKDSSIIPNDV